MGEAGENEQGAPFPAPFPRTPTPGDAASAPQDRAPPPTCLSANGRFFDWQDPPSSFLSATAGASYGAHCAHSTFPATMGAAGALLSVYSWPKSLAPGAGAKRTFVAQPFHIVSTIAGELTTQHR